MSEKEESEEGKNPDKPDQFVLALDKLKTGGDPSNRYPHNYLIRELIKVFSDKRLLKSTSEQLPWEENGPGNISGRTRCLIVDPDDNTGKTLFAGAVGGGIWKTYDAGLSWNDIAPELPNLSISCFAIALSNSSVIYAGTGEGYYNIDAIQGNGIFKTVDKGTSWEQLEYTRDKKDFYFVNRIIVDLDNELLVLAATNTGVMRSVDGGLSWKKCLDVNGARVQQIINVPNNFNIQFASVKSKGIFKSIDKGKTWWPVYSDDVGRIEISISEYNKKVLAAISEKSGVILSFDQGDNWIDAVKKKMYNF